MSIEAEECEEEYEEYNAACLHSRSARADFLVPPYGFPVGQNEFLLPFGREFIASAVIAA
jgi:hypothetical protein